MEFKPLLFKAVVKKLLVLFHDEHDPDIADTRIHVVCRLEELPEVHGEFVTARVKRVCDLVVCGDNEFEFLR